MNLMRYGAFSICAALLLQVPCARAELLKADDPLFGGNALTIDTSTGLGWLNLNLSVGLSYDMVRAATQPGGSFAGFRLASADEVLTLWRSAGLPGNGWYPEGAAFDQSIRSLISTLGATTSQDGRPEIFGISDTSTSPGTHVVPGLDFSFHSWASGSVAGYGLGSLGFGDTTSADTVGAWLVTPVPEPSPLALGLLGAAFFRLRPSRLTGRR